MNRLLATAFFVAFCGHAAAQTSQELPDPAAVRAFQNFWESFEDYERTTMKRAKKQYQIQWDRIKSEIRANKSKNFQARLRNLKEAAQKYKRHLTNYPDASNRPNVMLNLAQMYNMLGELYEDTSPDTATSYRQQALTVLKEVVAKFPGFADRAATQYLRALILEALQFEREARSIWRQLAASSNPSMQTVYANLAMGDYHFDQEEPDMAIPYYRKAQLQIADLDPPNKDFEKLRIEYRMAWAAYRATDLDLALKSALPLLQPGRELPDEDTRRKIQTDAIDLVGDTLYETDTIIKTKRILTRRELTKFAPMIGSRTLQRYHANNDPKSTAELGQFLVKEFPLAQAVPDWYNLTAGSLHTLGRISLEITYLERLAMLLPTGSLWRSQHKGSFKAVKNMETLAIAAAKAAAAYHYDHGLASGNKNSFMSSAAFYLVLIEHSPHDKESNKWRTRHAHCHYFGGKLEKADELYSNLKSNYRLSYSSLETSAYKLVLTREEKWRASYAAATAKGDDPREDKATIGHLRQLEEAVNEYANRFPNRNRSVELLLLAASANRDHDRFDSAAQYWERVLVSEPTPQQRAMAIRGLIAGSMKFGKAEELIKLTKRFLKLENWNALGLTLDSELHGVLSQAAWDEGERLQSDGKTLAAGALLVSLAQEFRSIPKREKMYRDGAYLLAIAGDWSSAEKAARSYIAAGLKANAGDMQYLIARSAEFQVRFADASTAYISLGQRFPRHPRATTSLQRAENLALAEDNYATAGLAAAILATRLKKRELKLKSYENAYGHYENAADFQAALDVANKRRRISVRLDDRLSSDLMVAKATYRTGEETKALVSLEKIAKTARSKKSSMRPYLKRQIVAESYLLLGEESQRFFSDFDIFDRQGSLAANIRKKTSYFKQLTSRLDYAASANHPEFSAKARYLLATSAATFGDIMRSIAKRRKVTKKAMQQYEKTANNLYELARKYHGQNLLARSANPKLYANNEWVKKSSIKQSGYADTRTDNQAPDQLPAAVSFQSPQQWSL